MVSCGPPGCSSLFVINYKPLRECPRPVPGGFMEKRGGNSCKREREAFTENIQSGELIQVVQDKNREVKRKIFFFHQGESWPQRRASSKKSLLFFPLLFSLSQPCKHEPFWKQRLHSCSQVENDEYEEPSLVQDELSIITRQQGERYRANKPISVLHIHRHVNYFILMVLF